MDGIQDFRKHGRIPRKLPVGLGMPEDDHEDSNAFCNINDLNSSLDPFIRHSISPFRSVKQLLLLFQCVSI